MYYFVKTHAKTHFYLCVCVCVCVCYNQVFYYDVFAVSAYYLQTALCFTLSTHFIGHNFFTFSHPLVTLLIIIICQIMTNWRRTATITTMMCAFFALAA